MPTAKLETVLFVLIALVAIGAGMIIWGEIINFMNTPHIEFHNKLGPLYKAQCYSDNRCVKVN